MVLATPAHRTDSKLILPSNISTLALQSNGLLPPGYRLEPEYPLVASVRQNSARSASASSIACPPAYRGVTKSPGRRNRLPHPVSQTPAPNSLAPLERQLQSELDLSGVQPRGSDHSIGHCTHSCAGLPEDRVVGEIEELRAKVQAHPLGDAELFRHREVQSDNARPDDVVPPAVAEAVRSHACRETDAVNERGQIVPVIRCWICDARRDTHRVRPARGVSVLIRGIALTPHRERESALQGQYGSGLPAAEYR